MDKPMGTRSTAWIAALVIAAATALAFHASYDALTHIDGVSVPQETR